MEDKIDYATEEQFQAACATWYWNEYKDNMLFAVDNNVSHRLSGIDRMKEGNRKKSIGVRAGVSDIIYIGGSFVLFIELKMKNGVQSDEQKRFGSNVQERGHSYVIVRSFQQFKELIWNLKRPISTGK
jgi:hypothetical protein